ncbi:hypothetical protein BH23CHL2_BH23CHL2_02320 [soil metagenome]
MSVQERASKQTKLVTVDDVQSMPDVPGMQLEINEGILVQVPGASVAHHLIVMAIVRLLDGFVSDQNLGYIFPDGVAYILQRDPDVLRIPDVSFLELDRLSEGAELEGYWQGAPDLAVEVVSPHDNAYDLHDKVHQYLESGTRLVWVVWPGRLSVSVHSADGSGKELTIDESIDGGDVLPGFSAPVARFFESLAAHRGSLESNEK